MLNSENKISFLSPAKVPCEEMKRKSTLTENKQTESLGQKTSEYWKSDIYAGFSPLH